MHEIDDAVSITRDLLHAIRSKFQEGQVARRQGWLEYSTSVDNVVDLSRLRRHLDLKRDMYPKDETEISLTVQLGKLLLLEEWTAKRVLLYTAGQVYMRMVRNSEEVQRIASRLGLTLPRTPKENEDLHPVCGEQLLARWRYDPPESVGEIDLVEKEARRYASHQGVQVDRNEVALRVDWEERRRIEMMNVQDATLVKLAIADLFPSPQDLLLLAEAFL